MTKSEIVDLELRIVYETDKAYCLIDDDQDLKNKKGVWIPKSQMEVESIRPGKHRKTRLIKFAIPEWLAMDKDLL